jgi:hypothetical protein
MQYMYLRRAGKAKNPGRHPFGMIGVQKLADGTISVGVLTIHSADRFDKSQGRRLMFRKIFKDRSALVTPGGELPCLTNLLGRNVSRLDQPVRHQEILNTLITDEAKSDYPSLP